MPGKLTSLDLSTCSLLNEDMAGLSHLVKANWPALKYLHLQNNNLTNAAVKVLANNSWPKLEYLDLRFNRRMSPIGARLLSNEQHCRCYLSIAIAYPTKHTGSNLM